MRTWLRVLVGFGLALLSWTIAAPAAAAPPEQSVTTYTNHTDFVSRQAANTPLGNRGPPSTTDRHVLCMKARFAVASLAGDVSHCHYPYDHLAAPASGDIVTPDSTSAEASVIESSTGVATNTGRAGQPRDALGRFTIGAGGESAATAAGRSAHANYLHTLGGGDYRFNVALPGSRLRPDAVSYSQNIVRELKPDTPGAIARGWRQVNAYKAYLEELTDQPWTAYVDVYKP